jgi:tRNA pseudouridine32 synthase / 23S rRNA pseudouridine746 synthase
MDEGPALAEGFTWAQLRAAVVEEDVDVLALNKPAGIAVAGERHETDLVELAQEAGEALYPVHRIDKVTSGLILLTKSVAVHGPLTRQFAKREVGKTYLMITNTAQLPPAGRIELPLGIGRKGRVRIAAARDRIRFDRDEGRWWVRPDDVVGARVYPSTTEFDTLWSDGERSVLLVRPITGRRHQIRVHFAWIGHPVFGDPLFQRAGGPAEPRTYLHSWRLSLDATWRDGRRLTLAAQPGADFWSPVACRMSGADPAGVLPTS